MPAYWQWSFPTGGEWEEASAIWHDDGTDSTGGSWTVNRNWTTLNRASPGSTESSSSEGTSSNGVISSGSTNGGSTNGGSSTDNTPDCSYCTDGCSSCQSSDDDAADSTCSICLGADVDATCTKCGETYHICTSQIGDCSVATTDDDWIFGAYHDSGGY